jgi:hypothetical protein
LDFSVVHHKEWAGAIDNLRDEVIPARAQGTCPPVHVPLCM